MKNLTGNSSFAEFKKDEIKHVWNLAGGGDCPCVICGDIPTEPPPPPKNKK